MGDKDQHQTTYWTIVILLSKCHAAVCLCVIDSMGSAHRNRAVNIYIADSRFAHSQWETMLFYNDVSHWLGASLESALIYTEIFTSCFNMDFHY